MKVYIDSSCLNRTFDDQSQPRIILNPINFISQITTGEIHL